MFGKCKHLFFISAILLTTSTMTAANICTEAMFGGTSYVIQDKARIDSSYFNEHGNEWTHKYIYNKNGQLEQMRYDSKEEDSKAEFLYFYYDTTETALKNKGTEYIILNCNTQDTLCIRQKIYYEGTFQGEQISKRVSNYASSETIESSTHWFTERILKNDTLFEIEYFDYNTDSVRKNQNLIVEDSADDFKCYEYRGDDNTISSITYKPNEKGYSISIDEGTYNRKFFFIKTEGTTSIRKTLKPIKIAPKARYFDLLGRYKFTK